MQDTAAGHKHSHSAHEDGVFLQQDWRNYTPEQHGVWQTLYRRRMEHLTRCGSRVFLQGARLIGLEPSRIPNLALMNARLAPRTGWNAVAVSGFLPAQQFFECLSQRRFPTTITIRPPDNLDYIPEPDIFHDVFGHVPLHADMVFADYLQEFGALASRVRSEEDRERMTRLFWFTVEFGLVLEDGEIKAYGSGLISSHGDCLNALSPACAKKPFSLEAVFAQDFEIDHVQPVLFVLDSFEQLFEATQEAKRKLNL